MDICVMYCSEHLGSTFFVIHHSLIYFFFFSSLKVILVWALTPLAKLSGECGCCAAYCWCIWCSQWLYEWLFFTTTPNECIYLVHYFCVQMWLDWDRFSGGCLDVDVLCQCLHQMAVCWVDFQPRVQTKRFKWVNLFLSDSLKSVQKC